MSALLEVESARDEGIKLDALEPALVGLSSPGRSIDSMHVELAAETIRKVPA